MRLRRKIAGLFILLMAAAVLMTIGYSILFIRDHLYAQKRQELLRFAQELMETTSDPQVLCQRAARRTYRAAVLDARGKLLCADRHLALDLQQLRTLPPQNDSLLLVSRPLPQGGLLVLALEKATVLEELRPIRWIIYHAMFVTLGLVALAAILLSLTLSRPIVRIKRTLEEIARGKPELLARDSRRKDEIGMIARALNSVSHNLQRDNVRLRELNDRQSRFYTDIAHELNNPLHVMKGALEMLRLRPDDPAAHARYLDILQNQTDRMAQLFQDVLTLQQADHQPGFVHTSVFRLDELATRAAQPYLDGIAAKGLVFHQRVPAVQVAADAARLEQVLDNLLSNALKYCHQGTIILAADVRGREVEVSVSDTGPGIAAEHLPHLTDRFYRTDSARARSQGGTGLGLAVVKSLLNAHGAELHIESRPGHGSCFSFCLPLA
ncbi:MAG: HAMP domain-containing protein [Bacteroidetes bacterium]|nr:HAMP domain-containing protein [Bacteroidota bacterium]